MLAELDNLPMMIAQLREQEYRHFSVYCCINQDDIGITNAPTLATFKENQQTLEQLSNIHDLDLTLIDHSSPGKGWTGKKRGVGWARKELFSKILEDHDDNEIIVSLDADTSISTTYLRSALNTLNTHPEWSAVCVPYYHPLTGNEPQDRALLRYEIYMRHYLINMLGISNPYAFTALGSAMVFPAWAYRRAGGITPLQGGEDFYLMQKFCKTGTIGLLMNEEIVRPQGRISNRVPFGTGPAIGKGMMHREPIISELPTTSEDSFNVNIMEYDIYKGMCDMDVRYPFFAVNGFRQVQETFNLMNELFDKDIETPMSEFLRKQLNIDNLWAPIRKNFKTKELFIHACQERVDGLRILQFLKEQQTSSEDNSNPIASLQALCQQHQIPCPLSDQNPFAITPLDKIATLRNNLFSLEMQLRQS